MVPLYDGPQGDEGAGGGIGQLVEFAIGFLRRQYAVIIFSTILTVVGAGIYLKTATPTFTGQVKILFSNQKTAFVQQQSLVAEATIDSVQIETQLQVLKSKAVATSVIQKLKLYDDRDFKSSDRLRAFFRRVRAWLSMAPLEPVVDETATADQLALAFADRLTANRVGMSNVIEVSYNASTADRAAEIANAVANEYILDQLNAKFEANKNATAWLQDRLRELGQQALTAERAVNAFKSENNLVVSDGKLIDDQQIAELNSRLVAARALTSDSLARLNRFEEVIHAITPDSLSLGGIDSPGSEVLLNPIINTLRQQYLDHARRESDWSSRFGKSHLAVINLRNRMRDIRTSIVEEVRRLSETSRSDYEIAKQKQQQIENQLASAVSRSRTSNSAELTMRELETSAKSYRSLYESFLQRYMGSVQQESFPSAGARIIASASPPPSKSKPKSSLIIAFGFAAGLGLGVGLGLLRDVMDRVFRTSAQLEAALRLPCLSLVPLLRDVDPPAPASPPPPGNEVRTISRRSIGYWAATAMPLSRFAESIRAIKLAIDLNQSPAAHKIVGITSSLPNEGKTTIAASLAQLIAHAGKRVIVVDCDLRNPSLSMSLAPAATAGLIEIIAGAKQLNEVTWHDKSTGLTLLPIAKKGPLFHTSEILSAEPTRALFDKLRASYDYVIVDLPPLAPIVDVRATTSLVDCFVLVVEWGRTKIDVVQHALHTAPNVGEAILGTVLNKIDMNVMKRYDSPHSDYYNSEHYGRYGYVDQDGK
ncbi:polysaccharide biosynthesis tyrosine autokinase [Rhodopseudomonas palustris]|uniref:polysaccharide biosynthesis tyrosine autokinase n=1 Tax=Rhodopseudomonas palustris TaxID=1076 RepID=UPI002ACD9BF4|nr:polysaccharide biosynthesis tyrosine autokinase [Rhodopseudomonas palustris]WQG97546.1 polysaccharide biosynthesis tyrosine autokinase [Rhodopseudomonas palustris]